MANGAGPGQERQEGGSGRQPQKYEAHVAGSRAQEEWKSGAPNCFGVFC